MCYVSPFNLSRKRKKNTEGFPRRKETPVFYIAYTNFFIIWRHIYCVRDLFRSIEQQQHPWDLEEKKVDDLTWCVFLDVTSFLLFQGGRHWHVWRRSFSFFSPSSHTSFSSSPECRSHVYKRKSSSSSGERERSRRAYLCCRFTPSSLAFSLGLWGKQPRPKSPQGGEKNMQRCVREDEKNKPIESPPRAPVYRPNSYLSAALKKNSPFLLFM